MGRNGCRTCCCTARGLLISLCVFQLISSVERQVFDFLGQMWAPIIFNFVSTLITITGLFGAYYRRQSYLGLFAIFQVAALGWNAFIIAFYLELGELSRETDYLSLGTGSRSWWAANGPNCEPLFNNTQAHLALYDSIRPISIDGCLLPFHSIEVLQAAINLVLTLFALIASTVVLCSKQKDDESDEFHYVGGFNSYNSPIDTTARLDPIYSEARYAGECRYAALPAL